MPEPAQISPQLLVIDADLEIGLQERSRRHLASSRKGRHREAYAAYWDVGHRQVNAH
jgi:hypothetical protein